MSPELVASELVAPDELVSPELVASELVTPDELVSPELVASELVAPDELVSPDEPVPPPLEPSCAVSFKGFAITSYAS